MRRTAQPASTSLFRMLLLVAAVCAPAAAAATEDPGETVQRIAVVVNDKPISSFDVEQRTLLTLVSSGAPNNPEIRERVRAQVLRTLIDEKLQLDEAAENKVEVTRDEIKASMERLAKQNNTSLEQISDLLDRAGIKISTLEQQIRAEIAWNKLISQRLAPRVEVSQEEVDDAMRRAEESADKIQYQVAEIFLSVGRPEEEDTIRSNAETVIAQLRAGMPFPSAARQFSESASAAAGGDLGWVTEGQLPGDVDKVLTTMRPNQISSPIRATGGYYIIAVRDMRAPKGMQVTPVAASSLPPGKVRLAQVLVPVPGGGREGMERAMQKAAALQARITGCSQARSVISAAGGGVLFDELGTFNRGELAGPIQQVLADVPNGQSTRVLGSSEGAMFFIVCDGGTTPKIETFEPPTREEIENRLFNQELSVLARRYLRDLRRDAVVEMR